MAKKRPTKNCKLGKATGMIMWNRGKPHTQVWLTQPQPCRRRMAYRPPITKKK